MLTLFATMIFLGVWQLQRLDERKETNVLISQRADAEPSGLPEGLAEAEAAGGDVRFIRVEMTGSYVGETLFIDNRTIEGSPGSWLATPFETGDLTIVVMRGFVGRATALGASPADLAAPSGVQTLTGLLQPGASGGAFAEGREGLAAISRPNISAVAERLQLDLVAPYFQLEEPAESIATPVPRPSIDNGPHLSYAVQWFLFASLAAIGYPLILRRVAREKSRVRPETALSRS